MHKDLKNVASEGGAMYEVSVGKLASLDPSCKVLEGQTLFPF